MDRNFKYIVIITIFIGILVLGGLSCFHYRIYQSVNTYSIQTSNLLNTLKPVLQNNNANIKNSKSIQNSLEHIQNEHSKEYYDFLKNYYETQNNWLNYWLATLGTLLTIIGLVIPYIFSKRWKDEKEEMNIIKEKFDKEVAIAEDKLNRLNVNSTKLEFDKMIADKQLELNEMITDATDNLWIDVDNKKEELILSIKKIIIEDILKNGPDTEYFLDKITDNIRDSIEKNINEKLEGEVDYE